MNEIYKDKLLKSNRELLFKFNFMYLIGHIIILIEAILFKVTGLAILNFASVALFVYNGFKIKYSSENYGKAEVRITAEVIIHQIIAFLLVGTNAGFQYIILASSIVMCTFYTNDKYKDLYVLKSVLLIGLFVIIESYGKIYVPIYLFSDLIYSFWTATIIFYCFGAAAYFTINSNVYIIKSLRDVKRESSEKTEKLDYLQKEVISSMANVIESRDGSTGEHTKRTSRYVEEIILGMKEYPTYKEVLTDEFVRNISLAAPLHDIGKLKIPDAVLQKPGKLSSEEFNVIKKHSEYGAEIINMTISNIEDKSYTDVAHNVALYHHERWDGTGYPSRLKGEEIPIEARIMAIADVYDALTTKRCYKEAMPKEKALSIIKDGAGTQFDPQLVNIFASQMYKPQQTPNINKTSKRRNRTRKHW